MLKMGMLGLGQAGSNIAEYGIQKGFKSVAANTAKIDLNLLKYIPQENRLYLGGNGAGRNREIGKAAIVDSAEFLYNLCKDKLIDCDTVFVSVAGGGGTGSGALSVAVDILSEMFNVINVIYVLPDNLESPNTKINTLDCFSELSQFENLGSIFIVDNEKAKQDNNGLAKFKIHGLTNKQVIDNLVEINEFTDKTSYTNNFDERDYLELLHTRGCTLISKININVKKNINDNDITASIQKSWRNSYSPNYSLNNIVKAAILGQISEKNSKNINFENIFNNNIPYDIKDSFYSQTNEVMKIYSIFSGLEFPMERIGEIKSNIEKLQDNLVSRIEKSKNQKLEGFDWKLKDNLISSPITTKKELNKINLSERLNKYK